MIMVCCLGGKRYTKPKHELRKKIKCLAGNPARHFILRCECLISLNEGLVSLNSNTLFLDACLLTCEVTEVVELSAAYLTNLVHFDAFDSG